ncbi:MULTISPECIES: FecCD family ABC transporter permease [unclassified Halomonas]|uniref:FecCD family ABC transporter permease n=1 Tax=unclassified Halomonas TaxID=2609666 RepID=UPI0021BDA59F|nr:MULTISPECIES: iron ABC transporter permease [unclassified Halomonas]
MVALFVLLGLAVMASLAVGAGELGVVDSLQVLMGQGGEEASFVVWQLRLPRTLVGLVVGIALGVSGTLLQSMTRNPLAEPGLLGVSAGAAFAVALMLLAGGSLLQLRIGVAQLGALAGCLCVLGVSRIRGLGSDPIRLVLAGAAFSGLLGALTSLILLTDRRAADEIRFWVVGSLSGRQLEDLLAVLPSMAIAGLALIVVVRPMASLALGERASAGLGHHPGRLRLMAVLIVAVLVGGATAVAGPIAFVGLVVPFVARAIAGPELRRTLWLCLPLGPLLVLTADVVSRRLVAPSEMPLGVLTALCGAPVLISVVRARRLPSL